jgi:hypothetical protein
MTLKHSLKTPRTLLLCALGASALLVAGCGGGDDPAAAPSLSGVAAVGTPIVGGTVTVKCAGGAALNATTSSGGNWQVSFSGQTLPCAVQVSGGTAGGAANSTPYHSIALSLGTVNLTPLTDTVMAQLLGSAPQGWFASPTFTGINTTALTTALNTVKTQLGLASTLGSINPLTSSFVARQGDTMDNILEAFKGALTALSKTYAELLAAAQTGQYTGFSGFSAAFSTAYSSVGSGGSGGAGSGSLTVAISIGGAPATSVVVPNVPAPQNQTAFCADIQNDSSITGLTSGGGTLVINSCSFSGNVGQVAATLTTTVPVTISLPYNLTYTYNP